MAATKSFHDGICCSVPEDDHNRIRREALPLAHGFHTILIFIHLLLLGYVGVER